MKLIKTSKIGRGFTLIEVMIVVVILGVLASVAVPAFINYIRRAKTAEAQDKISQIYRAAITYFQTQQFGRGLGDAITCQFPNSVGPTPGPCATACADETDGRCVPRSDGTGTYDPQVTWDTPSWIAVDFAINDPHYYVYMLVSANADAAGGVGSEFTARASGNLDGDNVCSTFERVGIVNDEAEVVGRGIYRNMVTE